MFAFYAKRLLKMVDGLCEIFTAASTEKINK